MTPDLIIDGLKYHGYRLPEDALKRAGAMPEHMTPLLLEHLDAMVADPVCSPLLFNIGKIVLCDCPNTVRVYFALGNPSFLHHGGDDSPFFLLHHFGGIVPFIQLSAIVAVFLAGFGKGQSREMAYREISFDIAVIIPHTPCFFTFLDNKGIVFT